MTRIVYLSPETKRHIAAGQVIENPASVVKELVENSLDAGARHITIILEDGGKKRITVRDDGSGIAPEDLHMALASFATSKLADVADLQYLSTFGFRGEALASMTTVAQVTLASRTAGSELGTAVQVLGPDNSTKHSVGMPLGTKVSVSELFATIPARRKFLRSAASEYRNCLEVVYQLALAHPTHSFEVVHNGKTTVKFHAESVRERLAGVLAQDSQLLFPVTVEGEHATVTGFLGAPQLALKSSKGHYLFVNNRPVVDTSLVAVVKQTLGTVLEPRMQPVFLLSITTQPAMVDVNVTPKKNKVAFYNPESIALLVKQAVEQVKEAHSLHYRMGRQLSQLLRDNTMEPTMAGVFKAEVEPWQVKDIQLEVGTEILQVHKLYLIAQTTHGVVVVDQHAAHERILFEQFLQAYQDKKTRKITKLSKAVVVTLSALEFSALSDQLQVLQDLGFEVQLHEATLQLTITAAPALLAKRDLAVLLREIAQDLLEGIQLDVDSVSHRTLAFLACRGAIKAGDILTQTERRALFDKLFITTARVTCPHGRPVYIDIDLTDLHRLFKRIL